MKFFIVLTLFVAAASARFNVPDMGAAEAAEIQAIMDAINHPSTDPATAIALQEMLNNMLGGQDSPNEAGPVITDGDSPAFADHLIIDESPVHAEPVIIDESSVPPSASPLVQIIVNVKSGAANSDNPVVIEDSRPLPPAIAGPAVPFSKLN